MFSFYIQFIVLFTGFSWLIRYLWQIYRSYYDFPLTRHSSSEINMLFVRYQLRHSIYFVLNNNVILLLTKVDLVILTVYIQAVNLYSPVKLNSLGDYTHCQCMQKQLTFAYVETKVAEGTSDPWHMRGFSLALASQRSQR